MDLPNDLRLALERQLRTVPPAKLAHTAAHLSARYRAADAGGPFVRTADEAAAYAALRMPATFAAVTAALGAARARLPGFAPQRLLDVGAGTGAALWAAARQLPTCGSATLIEAEPAMIALGKQLAAQARATGLPPTTWRHADVRTADLPAADLVTAAYALGELPAADRAGVVRQLWHATRGLLLIVEPGTPVGFGVIRAVREQLLAAGASIVAPCPHGGPCPMPADDWCHFAQRVSRPNVQQAVKGAAMGYEDEKFAYVAVGRTAATPIAGRVLRHPFVRKGYVRLHVCAPDGLQPVEITRSDTAHWRSARAIGWGDAWFAGVGFLPEPSPQTPLPERERGFGQHQGAEFAAAPPSPREGEGGWGDEGTSALGRDPGKNLHLKGDAWEEGYQDKNYRL
jgi:ribosomal protein RSM22 (predicted rRNA methylase)